MEKLTASQALEISKKNGFCYNTEKIVSEIHDKIRELSSGGISELCMNDGWKNPVISSAIKNEFEALGYDVFRRPYSFDLIVSWYK